MVAGPLVEVAAAAIDILPRQDRIGIDFRAFDPAEGPRLIGDHMDSMKDNPAQLWTRLAF